MVCFIVMTSSLYDPRHVPQNYHSHTNPIYAQDEILVDREIGICRQWMLADGMSAATKIEKGTSARPFSSSQSRLHQLPVSKKERIRCLDAKRRFCARQQREILNLVEGYCIAPMCGKWTLRSAASFDAMCQKSDCSNGRLLWIELSDRRLVALCLPSALFDQVERLRPRRLYRLRFECRTRVAYFALFAHLHRRGSAVLPLARACCPGVRHGVVR